MKRISLLLACLSSYALCLAQNYNPIYTAVPFVSFSPEARGGGMGETGAATAEGNNAMHWNISGLGFSEKRHGAAFSYTPWYRALVPDINLFYFSAYTTLDKKKKHTAAFSYRHFFMGEIPFINMSGTVIAVARPLEFAADLGYAYKINEKHSAGIAVRYIHSDLLRGVPVTNNFHPGRSIAGDIGYTYKPCKYFRYGFHISNIGNKVSYVDSAYNFSSGKITESVGDFIPMNLRTGVAFILPIDSAHKFIFTGDVNKLLVPTPPEYVLDPNTGYPTAIASGMDPNRSVLEAMYTSFYDAPGGKKEELKEIAYSAGFEYRYKRFLAARCGYFYQHKDKGGGQYLTFGAGLGYKAFGLDLAYIRTLDGRSPLENTMRFTLSAELDKLPKWKRGERAKNKEPKSTS